MVGESLYNLLNGEELSTLMAGTNTDGWGLDSFELENVELIDGMWTAQVYFSFSGDQNEEKTWCGDTITGSCIVEMDRDKRITFSEIDAQVDREDDSDDDPTHEKY
jgi:hypothetical protein